MASIQDNKSKSYASINTYLKRTFKKVKPDSQIKQDSIKVFDKIYYSILDNMSKFIHDIIKQNGLNTVTNDHLMTIFITDFFPDDFKEEIKERVIESIEKFRNYQEQKAAGEIEKNLNRTQQAGLIFPVPKTEKYVIEKVTDLVGKKHRFDQKGGFFITITAIVQYLMEMLIVKSSEYTKDTYSKIQVSPKFLCETIETETHFEGIYGKHTYTEKPPKKKVSKEKNSKKMTDSSTKEESDSGKGSSDDDNPKDGSDSCNESSKKETKVASKKTKSNKSKKKDTESDDIDNTIFQMPKMKVTKSKTKKEPKLKGTTPSKKKPVKEATKKKVKKPEDINQTIFNDSDSEVEYSDVDD